MPGTMPRVVLAPRINPSVQYVVTEEVVALDRDEPYDLLLVGSDRAEVSKMYWKKAGARPPEAGGFDDIFVARDGFVYEIREPFSNRQPSLLIPANALPEGHMLVVRTQVLLEFLGRLTGDRSAERSTTAEKALGSRERNALLNIIGALHRLILSPRAERISDAALIQELLSNFEDVHGISERNLQKKFFEAKKSLENSLK
jgi:hypothetical protein